MVDVKREKFGWHTVWLLCAVVVFATGCGGGSGTSGASGTPGGKGTGPVEKPIANAGPIQVVQIGETVLLDGRASTSASGVSLVFSWTVTAQPANSNVSLDNPKIATPSFVAAQAGSYLFELVVSTGTTLSERALTTVTARINASAPGFNHTGVSTDCVTCHNGQRAPGKSGTHLATSDVCVACHGTDTFTPELAVDHDEVLGVCGACHDGVIAIGKSPTHLATALECDACHNTTSFLTTGPGSSFNHAGIVDNCVSCHNGTVAVGKSANHIVTTADCVTCHTTVTFRIGGSGGGTFNHTGIVDNCVSCHDGTAAIGKPVTHIPTTADCIVCHTTTTFTIGAGAGGVFDHTGIVDNCAACHNGTTATGKPADHPSTTEDCSVCHVTTSFADVEE